MNYKMKVRITDPKTPKGMFSELFFDLECKFTYDENQYGNGHYVSIKGIQNPLFCPSSLKFIAFNAPE